MDEVEVDDGGTDTDRSSCRASSRATVLLPLAMGPVMTMITGLADWSGRRQIVAMS